ncbi:hypothetical protein JOD54_004285 [Actinokineospora baliensis]|uniref:hypothetical protein n=1 Tax=Actinokineospora baliensis TaxID=547056 RepID=UPI00195A3E52|nr:hypothetical protein [Actinokineospora baliensis]MBM7774081.1 hypothetical protein [Actinokineospora baliensis]
MTDPSSDEIRTSNTLSGDISQAVQAGSIHGGFHQHYHGGRVRKDGRKVARRVLAVSIFSALALALVTIAASRTSTTAASAVPEELRMLPVETDKNGTVDRCVKVTVAGAAKPGYSVVVGIHSRQDESALKNKRTYYPARVIMAPFDPKGTRSTRPDLAIGELGNDTASYDIFYGVLPTERAGELQNDLSTPTALNLSEMGSLGIDILDAQTVTRRPSSSKFCN